MSVPMLTSYWVTFPEDPHLPRGYGVTAWSLDDAYSLLAECGYDSVRRARRVAVQEGVTPHDVDARHVAPNSGPHVIRGVWFPAMNIGFGASGSRS